MSVDDARQVFPADAEMRSCVSDGHAERLQTKMEYAFSWVRGVVHCQWQSS